MEPTICRLQDASAVVNVEADGFRVAGTGVDGRGLRRSKGDGAHGERRVLIADGSPGRASVGGTPHATHCAADQDRVSGGVARIHGDGGDAAGNWREESSCRGRRTHTGPTGSNAPLGGKTVPPSTNAVSAVLPPNQ